MSAEGVQDLEMPEKFEIMRAVQKGLDGLTVALHVDEVESGEEWAKAVKTELCKIGRRFGYSVYARKNEVDEAYRDNGEWLYDVTWLEYEKNARGELVNLVDAPLVAECEWGNKGNIEDDFEKLLLARTGVRLMIFEGISNRIPKPRSEEVAERLAGMVREFNGSRAEDAWLLAAWERSADKEKGWSFRYFTIEMHVVPVESVTVVPFPPPN